MNQVTETFWFTLFATGALALFYWLSDIDQEGRSNWSKIVNRYFVVTSSPAAQQQPEESFDDDFDEEDENDVDGVAEADNESKELLHVAERAKVEALAALIVASRKKSFQNGEVPETRGLTSVFGLTVSSKPGSDYQRLRAMLKAELARREQPAGAKYPGLTEEQRIARQELGLEAE
jgi:hypothetical protein